MEARHKEECEVFETRVLAIIKSWRYIDYRINLSVVDGEWWDFYIKFSNGKYFQLRGYNNFPDSYDKLIKYLNKKLEIE